METPKFQHLKKFARETPILVLSLCLICVIDMERVDAAEKGQFNVLLFGFWHRNMPGIVAVSSFSEDIKLKELSIE